MSGNSRSTHPEVFFKKCLLKNLAKLTGKQLCQSLFFNNVEGLRSATLLKKRLWHKCFPVNFVKRPATLIKKRLWHRCFFVNFVEFLSTPFYKEDLWWLLLNTGIPVKHKRFGQWIYDFIHFNVFMTSYL